MTDINRVMHPNGAQAPASAVADHSKNAKTVASVCCWTLISAKPSQLNSVSVHRAAGRLIFSPLDYTYDSSSQSPKILYYCTCYREPVKHTVLHGTRVVTVWDPLTLVSGEKHFELRSYSGTQIPAHISYVYQGLKSWFAPIRADNLRRLRNDNQSLTTSRVPSRPWYQRASFAMSLVLPSLYILERGVTGHLSSTSEVVIRH
ncbi:hypothetical protein EDD15DRAFT_984419 [Pisolithus albus]|nr:hypothetical protein EDD15DRAFT_984419 [Pisolithus albus]